MDANDKLFLREYERRTRGYPIHAQVDPDSEGSFSWSSCDTCGTTLGGNRTEMVLTKPGVTKGGHRFPAHRVSSCDDCLMYAANGVLPSGAEE
jgi:hypothetical protein